MENWRNWCRFCAKYHPEDAEGECKMQFITEQLLEIVNKHFSLSLKTWTGSSICEDCSSFLAQLEHFQERCLKVDQMFNEILIFNEISDLELQTIRFRHGIDQKSNSSMEQILEQSMSSIDEIPEIKHDEDQNLIKEEIQLDKVKKKRGRPRKSDRIQSKIKQEFSDENDVSNVDREDLEDEENVSQIFVQDGIVRSTKRKTKQKAKRTKDEESDDDIPLKQLQKIKRIRLRTDNICEICSKNYSRRYLLNLHIRAVHSNEELPFVCSKCPKRFVTEPKLKVHEMIHLPDEEKLKHQCSCCGRKFAEMRQVHTHIRVVHQGDRPFICEQCGKSFATKRGLAEHRVTHSDEYPFHCPHCPKKFKSNPLLKRHVDTHNNTTYTCSECGISLNTQRTLKMHMLVHSDVKKYRCQHCSKEYKRAKALKEHLILHSGLRPYSCPFCDKTFTNGSNCRSHKKKAHPVELAALEASGEVQRVTNVPKLEQLQPK